MTRIREEEEEVHDDEMFMTRNLSIMPKTTEQHLIVHSDKSAACVTNSKRLLDVLYY